MVCRTAENHLRTGNYAKFGGIRRLGTIAREGCPGPFSIEEEEELLLWRLAQREHLEKKHLERKVYFLLVSLGQTCRILQFCVQGGLSLEENQTQHQQLVATLGRRENGCGRHPKGQRSCFR